MKQSMRISYSISISHYNKVREKFEWENKLEFVVDISNRRIGSFNIILKWTASILLVSSSSNDPFQTSSVQNNLEQNLLHSIHNPMFDTIHNSFISIITTQILLSYHTSLFNRIVFFF